MKLKANPYSEFAIGLAFAAGGVGICLHAAGLRPMPGMVVGSGLFPMITGACMTLFGLIHAASVLLARRDCAADRPVAGDGSPPASGPVPITWLYSVAVLIGLAILTGAMPSVGFLLCGMVFTAAVSRLGGAGWVGSLVFSVAITCALYTVFVYGLRVQLPRGIWAF